MASGDRFRVWELGQPFRDGLIEAELALLDELEDEKGREAAQSLRQAFGADAAAFVRTDVGDERSVRRLSRQAEGTYGQVDIVINNATVAPPGAVRDLPIETWDGSYRVNLRGPVLLARAFLPSMVARNWGVLVCVSSTGLGFMGAYEFCKAAQVHLCATLNQEMEGRDVAAFTVGPGFAPTETAVSSVPKLATMMGLSQEEMRALLADHTLSVEAAGAGFAAAVAMAPRHRGQEISSIQGLADAGIQLAEAQEKTGNLALTAEQRAEALKLCRSVRQTLAEQSAGWKERSVFERQWLVRTFRQRASLPAHEWLGLLDQLEAALAREEIGTAVPVRPPFARLAAYYGYLYEMAKGYVKDPSKREEQLASLLR